MDALIVRYYADVTLLMIMTIKTFDDSYEIVRTYELENEKKMLSNLFIPSHSVLLITFSFLILFFRKIITFRKRERERKK